MNNMGRRTIVLGIVSLMIMGGLMVLPSKVLAKNGQPDLQVRSLGVRYPMIEGEELPVTVYVENAGNAATGAGFWIDFNYASTPGFWQSPDETRQIWVDKSIRAGEIYGVCFTTTALSTGSFNFAASIDVTGEIAETDESNNGGNMCLVAVDAVPGTVVTVPVYFRNTNLNSAESFLVGADETTLPEDWSITGGIPPETIDSPPGGNAVAIEHIYVPEDAMINPTIRIGATRQSDGADQSVYIKVITTPEIGLSFNPHLNELFVTGSDVADTQVTVTTETLSTTGVKTVSKYTVTNSQGVYTSAIVEMISAKGLNMFKICEMDYNGALTITPDQNLFVTTFNVKDGVLKQYNQVMLYSPEALSLTHYDSKALSTSFRTYLEGESTYATIDGWQGLGVRISNGEIRQIRMDTTDPTQPCCANGYCWTMECVAPD
jgi:hypothetical protein